MAVKSKEDLIASIKAVIGEDTTDESLSLLEDVSDTFTSFETETKDKTDWKAKYNELDESWRKKYRDRFMSGSVDEEDDFSEVVERKVPRTYADLFTTI
mgnify:CR=1 FL=1